MTNEYHIHIDAKTIHVALERTLTETLQFMPMDFEHPAQGELTYAPARHLSKKLFSLDDYRSALTKVLAEVRRPGAMAGYVEGEYVPSDLSLPFRQAMEVTRVPFGLLMSRLPAGEFRESEIHLTMAEDESDVRVLKQLAQAGFMVARLTKTYGMAIIFTAQGSRKIISQVKRDTLAYLEEVGGVARCALKEEVVIDWWRSDESIEFPPVVSEVFRHDSHSPS